MRRPFQRAAALAALLAAAAAAGARAAEYDVPSVATPTIDQAVLAAAVSPDLDNAINLLDPLVVTTQTILIGNAFTCQRRLAIRPKPGIAGFRRVTIVADHGNAPIFRLTRAACVTLQDLDILRRSYNWDDLVRVEICDDVVIERCRIGLLQPPTANSWSALRVDYPTHVVVRNCITFSVWPGNLGHAVDVLFGDTTNSILLYDNVVANYRWSGFRVSSDQLNSLVLLRNNVAINDPDVDPLLEPSAYVSNVTAAPRVVSTHNVAFASPGKEEQIAAVQSIAGTPAGGAFLAFPRPSVDWAFVARAWDTTPGHPNQDFYRLLATGILHDDPSKWGLTVANGVPDAADVAVRDDVERDARPGGMPAHTDRGADQIEPGTASDTGQGPFRDPVLLAAPRGNPLGRAEVLYVARQEGELVLEVFDAAGRLRFATRRPVAAGESGTLAWSDVPSSGLFHYRLRLVGGSATRAEVKGKLVVLR